MSADPNHPIHEFEGTVARDFAKLFLGPLLGSGAARYVFVHALDPSKVIKIERGVRSFQNVQEWDVWDRVKKVEKVAKWFAPCHHISPCGIVLVMERTAPALNYPTHVPAFFTDLKAQNFGALNGQLVAHDYGLNLLAERGMTSRMRKADWWHLTDSNNAPQ